MWKMIEVVEYGGKIKHELVPVCEQCGGYLSGNDEWGYDGHIYNGMILHDECLIDYLKENNELEEVRK